MLAQAHSVERAHPIPEFRPAVADARTPPHFFPVISRKAAVIARIPVLMDGSGSQTRINREATTAIRRSVQILNGIAKYEGEEITQVQQPDFAQRFENC